LSGDAIPSFGVVDASLDSSPWFVRGVRALVPFIEVAGERHRRDPVTIAV